MWQNNTHTKCTTTTPMKVIELSKKLDQFATLASRIEIRGVTPFSPEGHTCHSIHTEINDKVNYSILEWLNIALSEEHVEPSQPSVGRKVGWPCRPLPTQSLWIDFACWCRKKQLSAEKIPDKRDFFELLDRMFVRKVDKYEFPSLEAARNSFILLKEQYAYN